MTSDSVLAISISVAVTVKGGGGVRNHVYVSINKKKMLVPSPYTRVQVSAPYFLPR